MHRCLASDEAETLDFLLLGFISSRLPWDGNKPGIKVDRSIEWLNWMMGIYCCLASWCISSFLSLLFQTLLNWRLCIAYNTKIFPIFIAVLGHSWKQPRVSKSEVTFCHNLPFKLFQYLPNFVIYMTLLTFEKWNWFGNSEGKKSVSVELLIVRLFPVEFISSPL